MMRPRHRGGRYGFSSGYCTVSGLRNVREKTIQRPDSSARMECRSFIRAQCEMSKVELEISHSTLHSSFHISHSSLLRSFCSPKHYPPCDQEIDHCKRHHDLPAEGQKLIETQPWEGRADQNDEHDEDECFEDKPESRRQPWPVPSSKKQHDNHG